uniref:Uncharacterized protein n=1 Tax=Glossina brevipalpis TaxID=37001 RepID=A0A1A9WT42_9MUSC
MASIYSQTQYFGCNSKNKNSSNILLTTNTTSTTNNNNNNNKNNNNNNNNNINHHKNQSRNQTNSKSKKHALKHRQLSSINPIIFPPGATLVEEEDFNELTAVPTSTIVIATNAKGDTKITTRHLPPLKLNGKTTTPQGPSSTIAATVKNVLQRQQTSSTSPKTPKVTANSHNLNISAQLSEDSQTNEFTPLVSESQTISTKTPNGDIKTFDIDPVNTITDITSFQLKSATNVTTSITNTAAVTTTTYSHNSKTTRSWPVIYRNPHHYDYEALYAHGNANKGAPPANSVSFRQNCYSNQFKQSIVYSSSNEDLATINECIASGGGGTSGFSNHSNQQTTCYYFAPNRHNSIYEHPAAVLGSSLHFDNQSANAANTAATAAAIESIRHSNSILLRNSSCSSKIMQQLGTGGSSGSGVIDSSNSITSAMDGTNHAVTSTCCSNCCIGPPPVLFLFITLLMTTSATAMLCAAIMTDHWEHVIWDRHSLDKYTNRSNLNLDWIMNDKIAMLKPDRKGDHRFRRDTLFLVPMHGGIWTLCIDLPLHELQELRRHPKFPPSAPTCLNYLAGSSENARGEEQRNDWQHSESQTPLQPHLRTYGTI